jgi:hypothetical protein
LMHNGVKLYLKLYSCYFVFGINEI